VWSFSTEGSKSLQVAILLVPRLLVQFLAFFTTASFLGWLLFFKDEPAEFRLKHFLQPEHYPTVCHSMVILQKLAATSDVHLK
jgi:hypothetical protein